MFRTTDRPAWPRGLLACIPLVLAASTTAPALGDDQPGGFTPEEAAARMVLPSGFHAEVAASEPLIRQPVAAHFDERGRLWVVEYLQYPHPNGLTPVSVDVYLRTEYDKFPEPPPHGPKGADRVSILEDTDGDGRMDRKTVFVEGLNLASGVAVGHGGVFVAQAPYLLFYPDKDRDDVPDGDPEVLLSGFGLQDAHAVVNSLTWGPDGWLYGAQGSTVTANIRGHSFQQGIWRYHPITREFELFAEGGGNTWGVDFDPVGRLLGSSNSSFVAFHMVQGGYYWKGFAKHGPLHNPRTFGYFDALSYQGRKPGGHVTPGGIVYQGDAYPEPFRGAFVGGNLLSNAVYWHLLEPKGSTLEARFGGTLIDSRDAWFRPIDLLTGPDGCIYVVDWYDRRASHLDPRDNWDKTNGRVYRVVHGERPKVEPFDLSGRTTAELIQLQGHPNAWWADTARRILAERRDATAIPSLRASLDGERDEPRALRLLWALDVSGGVDEAVATDLLEHPVPGVRRWAIRLLGDRHQWSESIRDRLADLAASEPDPGVRSQLAASCQRWKPDDALPVLVALAGRDEDATDEHIPLQIWWAAELAFRTEPGQVCGRLASPEMLPHPIVRDVLLERLARASALDRRFDLVATLLDEARPAGLADRVVQGVERGLEGQALAEMPGPLAGAFEALWSSSEPGPGVIRLGVRLGSEAAYGAALDRVGDASAPEAERLALVELIGQVPRPSGRAALIAALGREASPTLLAALLNALSADGSPEAADSILARFETLPAPLRSQAIDRLVSRKEWAGRLFDAMERGRVEPDAVTTSQAEAVVRLGDPALNDRLRLAWGKLPERLDEARAKRIAEVRGILPEGDKGDARRGADVFRETCAGCHRLFGQGETIGPELTGAERGSLDFLLESLVAPSEVIRKEYQPMTLATKDGRVLNGLIVEESDAAVTLFDSNRQRTVVSRDQVEELRASDVSVMPEGLLDKLSDAQVRDLFRFLQAGGPPE
jgi:putative membrane-bound dehydrogenase-like protein